MYPLGSSEKREREKKHDGVSCFLGAHVVEEWMGAIVPLSLFRPFLAWKVKKDMYVVLCTYSQSVILDYSVPIGG